MKAYTLIKTLLFIIFISNSAFSGELITENFGSNSELVIYKPVFEGRSVTPDDDIPSIWDLIPRSGDEAKGDKPPRVRGNGGQPYGCVTGDTLIELSNGEQTYIKNLSAGDLLKNQFDDVVGAYYTLKGPEKSSMFMLKTESGKKIVATKGHPFYGRNGLKRADSFKKGSEILTIDGFEKLEVVKKVSFSGDVYNLAVAPKDLLLDKDLEKRDPFLALRSNEHTVILNGIISGDIILQRLLETNE